MRYERTYKVILSCVACILTGCQTNLFDVKAVYSNPDIHQNLGVDEIYEQGKLAFKEKDMMRALTFFKAAYARNPHSIRTLNGLGSVYDHLQRFDLAEDYYFLALQLDPLSRSTLNNLGYSYLLQNKPALAVDYFRKAERIDAGNSYVQNNLMIAEQKLEKRLVQAQPAKKRPAVDKKLVKKHQQHAVVKLTSKVQHLKTEPAKGEKLTLAALKRPVGYQLMLNMKNEIYDNRISATQKVAQKVKISEKPIILATMSDVVVVSQPVAKKSFSYGMPLVEISNGAGRRGMAARMKKYMVSRDISVKRLTNADHFSHMTSRIFYQPGWEKYAKAMASQLPIPVFIEEMVGLVSEVRLEIGGDLLNYDAELIKQYRGKT